MSETGTKPSQRGHARIQNSQLVRIGVVGLLLLGLQIPILLIDQQIGARQATRDEAVREVTSRWGGEQRILGPVLRVPYRATHVEVDDVGRRHTREVVRHASFLPQDLEIVAEASGETRYRGIFDVPVYRSRVDLVGSFGSIDFADWDVPADKILWDRAELLVGLSDARALRGQPVVVWQGGAYSFEPGGAHLGDCASSLRAKLAGDRAEDFAGPMTFEIPLELNGAVRIAFAPVGDSTVATLRSNWPDPSFEGRWLPAERSISPEGFSARWEVSQIGRGYPRRFASAIDHGALMSATFGVGFLSPVDPYRMAERSVKYELLFLALPFLTLWLFEVVGGIRVHPVQYLFIGAALCLFYLLQLALAEHLGFGLAYTIAAASVAGTVLLYGRAILGAGSRASVLGALVAALYGYLYILLREQDFAFLLGSLGLFAALALAMWLTRKVDWYALDGSGTAPQTPR